MPLDRENGERVEGLQTAHVVIPTEVLAGLTNVLTECEFRKGLRRVRKNVPLFDDAVTRAYAAFRKAGSLSKKAFDDEDVLVQVYPQEFKVAVLFQRKVRGRDHYFHRQYDLPKVVIDALLERAKKPALVH